MDVDVVIVGGGPVGLFLAAELQLAGATTAVLERLAEPDPRKNDDDRGLTARTVQTLDLRGLAEPAAGLGLAAVRRLAGLADHPVAGEQTTPQDFAALMASLGMANIKGDLAMVPLIDHTGELTELPPPLMVLQGDLEQLLADRAAELGVPIRRDHDVIDFTPDEHGVTAMLADGGQVRGAWLVGCDGGRSTIRQRGGFEFVGSDPSMVARIAVAHLADPDVLAPGLVRNPAGMLMVSPPPTPTMTVEFAAPPPDRHSELTAEEFQASLRRVSGAEVTVTSIAAPVRLTDNARQATTYRHGRVLLAGDAAHVHSPIGGQGLNLGLQDAANLGWKLALVVRGLAPSTLLDTYTSERHPVGAQVLRNSRAETALLRTDPQTEALRELLTELVQLPQAIRHLAEMANGLHTRYAPDAGAGNGAHPLVGQFAPDLHLTADHRPARLAELLRDGRGLLLDLADTAPLRLAAAGWTGRVNLITAPSPDRDDLAALLVRPDGYTAWASGPTVDLDPMRSALTRWFGPPAKP